MQEAGAGVYETLAGGTEIRERGPCGQLTEAINKAEHQRFEAHRAARQDRLTGLANRKYVEEPAQLVQVQALGCDAVEGYLFSRPLSAAEAEAILREKRIFRAHDMAARIRCFRDRPNVLPTASPKTIIILRASGASGLRKGFNPPYWSAQSPNPTPPDSADTGQYGKGSSMSNAPSPSSNPSPRKRLPVRPSLEHLRKQAKRRARGSGAELSRAQRDLAHEYGVKNWTELAHMVETMLRGADQFAYVQYEMEDLPGAANSSDRARVRAILASGEFTQHDLDLALARSVLRFDERREIARLLLEHGADPDGQYGSDYGPIVFVTGESLNVEGLRFLIDAGADVTFGPIDTKYGPQCPLSCWLGTYVRGRNEAKHHGVELLLAHDAFIPHGVTPPMMAVHRGDVETLRRLLDADPALLTHRCATMPYVKLHDLTLLHYAAEFGEEAVIRLLVERGADLNAPAADGTTPAALLTTSWNGAHHELLRRLLPAFAAEIDWTIRFGQPARTMREQVEVAARADKFGRWGSFYPRAADDMKLLDEVGSPPIRWPTVIHALAGQGCTGAVAELLDERPELLTPLSRPGQT